MKKRKPKPNVQKQLSLLINIANDAHTRVVDLEGRASTFADVGGVRTIGEEVNRVVNRLNEVERRLDTGQSNAAKAIFARLSRLEKGEGPVKVSPREAWLERECRWLRGELDYYTRRAR